MIEKIKINGIRLNRNYIQVTQEDFDKKDLPCIPFYQILDSNRINMVFMTLNTIGKSFISGSVALKNFGQMGGCQDPSWSYHPNVCTLSIYPHHFKLQVLGFLLSLFGRHNLSFQHMVSSNSMLTLVVGQQNCDSVMHMLSAGFDLPKTHTPFEQEENAEQVQFLKKKYPEIRATYVEKKIKTYGITLLEDLVLGAYSFSVDQLVEYGEKIQFMAEETFFYTSAHMISSLQIDLFLLTKKALDIPAREICPVDLLSFLGPHFGDRHSIIGKALNCLSLNAVPVFQVGCTGASISMVLPHGKGKIARQTLVEIFEIP